MAEAVAALHHLDAAAPHQVVGRQPVRPARRRTWIEPLVTSPRSACSRLEIAFSVVVLPAPLAPSSATMPPLRHRQRDALQHEDDVIVDDLDVVRRRGRWSGGRFRARSRAVCRQWSRLQSSCIVTPPSRRRRRPCAARRRTHAADRAQLSFEQSRGVIFFSAAYLADCVLDHRVEDRQVGLVVVGDDLPLLAVPLLDAARRRRPGGPGRRT